MKRGGLLGATFAGGGVLLSLGILLLEVLFDGELFWVEFAALTGTFNDDAELLCDKTSNCTTDKDIRYITVSRIDYSFIVRAISNQERNLQNK